MTTPYSWIQESNGDWHRPMVSGELFTYATSADGIPRFNILPSLRVKLDKPERIENVSNKFKRGCQALFYQVPNASFRGVLMPDGKSFDMHYQINTTAEEAKEWLHQSFEEKINTAGANIPEVLKVESGLVGERRMDLEKASAIKIRAIYFADEEQIVHEVGLVAMVMHFAFDGTGTYNLFSKLLSNIANGTTIANESLKATPEIPFFEALPEEVFKADHSQEIGELINGYTGAATAHKILRDSRPFDELACMSESRCHFTSEETTLLLAKAKRLGVTISQLAQAAHLVALFTLFPAEQSSNIIYCGLVNVRQYAGLAPPYYSNATAPYFGRIPFANLSPAVLQGRIEKASDIQDLFQIALDLTATVKTQVKECLSGAVAVGQFTTEVMKHFDVSAPAAALPLSTIADGLLDRYVQHEYIGKGCSLRVLDVHLILLDPSPIVQVRTSSFDNRLSLSLSYNAKIYNETEVNQMSRSWGNSLRAICESARREQVPMPCQPIRSISSSSAIRV